MFEILLGIVVFIEVRFVDLVVFFDWFEWLVWCGVGYENVDVVEF